MKATIFAALVSVLSVAVQASGASWYVPSRNITCTGASDGQISCDAGHIDNAPEVSTIFSPSHPVMDPTRFE